MQDLKEFQQYLISEEKSAATVEKYLRDVRAFFAFADNQSLTKQLVIDYKQSLLDGGYRPASINSMLASVNAWLRFAQLEYLKVRQLKIQTQIYRPEEKELTRQEYFRLIETALCRGDQQLALMIQTICATGIRISELQYITVEAAVCGTARIHCKGKHRTVFIVSALRQKLLDYARERGLESGTVFLDTWGAPLDRTCIWRRMKSLCKYAGVTQQKVYPHNLRHLFAREYYEEEKDLAKLADILGHSSINTTRIYVQSTGSEHQRQLERLGLVI